MEQAPTFRAVVFDLDGTLVDTVGDLALALNRTLADFGLPPHAKSKVRGMVGGGLAKPLEWGIAAYGATLGPADQERALGLLCQHYAAYSAAHSCLYPDVRETLNAPQDAGIACGLCTNKPEPVARDLLRALGLSEAFGVIQGSDIGFPRKPAPAGLFHVAAGLGAEPDTSVTVGDSATDLKTARAAGLKGAVLVSYG